MPQGMLILVLINFSTYPQFPSVVDISALRKHPGRGLSLQKKRKKVSVECGIPKSAHFVFCCL